METNYRIICGALNVVTFKWFVSTQWSINTSSCTPALVKLDFYLNKRYSSPDTNSFRRSFGAAVTVLAVLTHRHNKYPICVSFSIAFVIVFLFFNRQWKQRFMCGFFIKINVASGFYSRLFSAYRIKWAWRDFFFLFRVEKNKTHLKWWNMTRIE